MSILIDGYNLMHAAGFMKARFGPHGLEKARGALLGILAASMPDEADQTTVVFDAAGSADTGTAGEAQCRVHGIRVLFAVNEQDADTLIEKLVRSDPVPKQLTVVSGDRRIRSAAKRRGSRSIDSESFWHSLMARRRRKEGRAEPTEEKPSGRAPGSREYWLEQFNGLVSDEELRELGGFFSDESPGDTSS